MYDYKRVLVIPYDLRMGLLKQKINVILLCVFIYFLHRGGYGITGDCQCAC